jgi:hypothetical protein
MRFGNSSDYFGLESNQQNWIARNSATGKAFLRWLYLEFINSSVIDCSKVISPSEKAVRRELLRPACNACIICDTNAR